MEVQQHSWTARNIKIAGTRSELVYHTYGMYQTESTGTFHVQSGIVFSLKMDQETGVATDPDQPILLQHWFWFLDIWVFFVSYSRTEKG